MDDVFDLTATTESEAQDQLQELINEATNYNAQVWTFEEQGVLTQNAGLIVRLPNGAEYQLTIVRSQRGQ